jgi:malyl-CoA/(S)-citramalyl-CoA lyase
MSHTLIKHCTARLNRSELAVPGSNASFIEKAAQSDADVVFLDLEDAVAPPDKERARKQVIEALQELDWRDKAISVRVNGLDTPYMYRDVVDVMEQAGDRLDLLMIPKVGTAADVYMVDALVNQIEMAKGYRGRVGFELIIETALGMQNVHEIAAASDRNESLHFGVADYAASTQARTISIGGSQPDYHTLTDPSSDGSRERHLGDMWHYALARMVVAARANGLRPLDGPFGDHSDPQGYESKAQAAAVLGCEGKWAIHPSQVALANRVFSPSEEETDYARRVLAAMQQAEEEGRGAVSLDGRLIDLASIRQAEVMVRKAQVIEAKS